MLAATLTTGGLFAGNSAVAQTQVKYNDKNSIELTAEKPTSSQEANQIHWDDAQKISNTRSSEDDVSPRLFFSNDKLIEAMKAAGISKDQGLAFANAYCSHLDDEMKISAEDLIDSFIKADFTNEQAQKFSNSLLAVKSNAADKENVVPSVPQQEQNRQFEKSYKVVTDNAKLTYQIDEKNGQVLFSGSISLNTAPLMPQIYITKDNKFKCGPKTYSNERSLQTSVNLRIRNLAMEELVAKDLKRRLAEGENLGKVAQNFIQRHEKNMDAYGLYVNENGKLQQKDPRYTSTQSLIANKKLNQR